MTIDTVRTAPERSSPDQTDDSPTLSPRVIDVSDRPFEEVTAYVDDAEREDVYFERRGDRTYLVA